LLEDLLPSAARASIFLKGSGSLLTFVLRVFPSASADTWQSVLVFSTVAPYA
jgi:hypothetical protein